MIYLCNACRSLQELQPATLSLLSDCWAAVCAGCPLQPLLLAACPQFSPWLDLLARPGWLEGEVWRGRECAARLLGCLAGYVATPLPGDPGDPLQLLVGRVLGPQLEQAAPVTAQLATSLTVLHWLKSASVPPPGLENSFLPSTLLSSLTRSPPQDEDPELELLTRAATAAALAHCGPDSLPAKLNPVIRPLMEAVKVEDGEGAGQLGRVAREVQQLGAGALARVVAACLARPPPQPTDKLLTNLCAFVCSNPGRCPPVTLSQLTGEESEQVQSERGILSLIYSERGADWEGEAGVGAALVLTCLAREHGPELPSQLARLWELATQLEGEPQQAVGSLAVLAVLCPALHPVLHPRLTALLPLILGLACHGLTAVRYGAGAGLAVLAATLPGQVLEGVVDTLLPALQPARPLPCRQGAVEAVHLLADRLQLDIVPYIVLLLVPVLGAMSDPDRQVRLLATNTFAGLVRLLPLDGAGAGELPPALQNKKAAESMFLAQLLEPGTMQLQCTV